MDLFTKLMLAGACLSAFAWAVVAQRRFVRKMADAYLRLTHLQRVLVALAVIICSVYAQKSSTNDVEGVTGTNGVEFVEGETNDLDIVEGGTNGVENGEAAPSPLLMGMLPLLTSGEAPLPQGIVADEVVARGYRIVGVTTNADYSYAMPRNGTVVGNWHVRGAYEDVVRVGLGEFRFPLGTNFCDHLWASVWGVVRPRLGSCSNGIAAVGAPMSAIPDVSRFWTAATSNDTYLLTWENFALGRVIEPNPISSVNPVDPNNPLTSMRPYGPVQDLSVIGETNAYCWVDIVLDNADAWVRFEGDGPSNLADPSFAAKAGETNRVVILIGKTYRVTCDMPFTVVGKSDPAIDEWWGNDNTLWLNWPVDIWAVGDDEDVPLSLGAARLCSVRLAAGTASRCVSSRIASSGTSFGRIAVARFREVAANRLRTGFAERYPPRGEDASDTVSKNHMFVNFGHHRA